MHLTLHLLHLLHLFHFSTASQKQLAQVLDLALADTLSKEVSFGGLFALAKNHRHATFFLPCRKLVLASERFVLRQCRIAHVQMRLFQSLHLGNLLLKCQPVLCCPRWFLSCVIVFFGIADGSQFATAIVYVFG